MRVAHVITRLIVGGAQENTVLCCEDLVRRHGDDVLLVTGPALGPEGSLVEKARAGGVPVEILPSLRRPIHPLRDAAAYFAVKRVLKRFQPEVVHTHSAKAGLLGRVAASALGTPAVVHTVHGAPFHPYQNRFARTLFQRCERYAAGRCHAMVAVADAMTDLMVRAHVAPRDKFRTVYSGMDVDAFLAAGPLRSETRTRLGYDARHVVVGTVARLFKLKGHDDIIDAAVPVVRRFPEVRFLFVGDGIFRGRLRAKIASLGLDGHFQFVGLVPPAEVPALLAATDLVVHASLREGLARVLPQALIVGRPAISYDVDGAREVVIAGETGRLVAPCDVAGLSRAMEELVGDAALRERLGRRGQERFADPFRHEWMTEQLRRIYEELLETGVSAQ